MTLHTLRAQSFTSLIADIRLDFLNLADALMEHFLDGIALLKH